MDHDPDLMQAKPFPERRIVQTQPVMVKHSLHGCVWVWVGEFVFGNTFKKLHFLLKRISSFVVTWVIITPSYSLHHLCWPVPYASVFAVLTSRPATTSLKGVVTNMDRFLHRPHILACFPCGYFLWLCLPVSGANILTWKRWCLITNVVTKLLCGNNMTSATAQTEQWLGDSLFQ